jgi:S1-C subfamily serine protease
MSTTALAQHSQALADLTAHLGYSIVTVSGRGSYGVSGVVVGSEWVITSDHTTERDRDIAVYTPGRNLVGQVRGRHPGLGLALLRVSGLDLPSATWRSEPRLGELVLVIGRPGTSDAPSLNLSLGVVAGEARMRSRRGPVAVLQTDAASFTGMSGGAMVAMDGTLLGLVRSDLARGVVLATPAAELAPAIAHLQQHGSLGKPYLGIGMQVVKLGDGQRGLLVSQLEPNSPANQAGVLLGDIILAADNLRLRRSDDLMALLRPERIGQTLVLEVLRAGQVQHLSVTIGERPKKNEHHA